MQNFMFKILKKTKLLEKFTVSFFISVRLYEIIVQYFNLINPLLTNSGYTSVLFYQIVFILDQTPKKLALKSNNSKLCF